MWVADPCVEDSARVRGPVLEVVVDPPGHHLLAEADHVGAEAELGVAPHTSSCSSTSLHLDKATLKMVDRIREDVTTISFVIFFTLRGHESPKNPRRG